MLVCLCRLIDSDDFENDGELEARIMGDDFQARFVTLLVEDPGRRKILIPMIREGHIDKESVAFGLRRFFAG